LKAGHFGVKHLNDLFTINFSAFLEKKRAKKEHLFRKKRAKKQHLFRKKYIKKGAPI
jgi:hypothetical protein